MKKRFALLSLFALTVSCAPLTYGTGRLNPIVTQAEGSFKVKKDETHYIALEVPAATVSAKLPPAMGRYSASSFVRPTSRHTSNLNSARWRPWATPAGWSVTFRKASLDFETTQRLGSASNQWFEVLTDVQAYQSEFVLTVSVPDNTRDGTYTIEGQAALSRVSSDANVRIRANVRKPMPATNSSTSSTSNPSERRAYTIGSSDTLELKPGGEYTLTLPLSDFETRRAIGDLTPHYFEVFDSSVRDDYRINSDDWTLGTTTLPNAWQLELLERDLSVRVIGQRSVAGNNLISTRYTAAYNPLKLLFGLKAIGAAPGEYMADGQIQYLGAPTQGFEWAVMVEASR
jgi:hypothetical protein